MICARYLIVSVMLIFVCCSHDQPMVIASERLVGAEVRVDGVIVGRLLKKQIVEVISFDGARPRVLRTRSISKLLLPPSAPGDHLLTVRNSEVEIQRQFQRDQALIDLSGAEETATAERSR